MSPMTRQPVIGWLQAVDDGWGVWHQQPPLGATVLVQLATRADGRIVITGLRIDGAPTSALLRAIPIGRIQAAANARRTG